MPAYDPLLNDDEARVIDPNTLVKNLKSTKLELREKIFVDKPVHKQLEITLEEKQGINTTSALQRQMTVGLTGGQIQGGYFGGTTEVSDRFQTYVQPGGSMLQRHDSDDSFDESKARQMSQVGQ